MQHVPIAKGGANPTAYMISLNAGETVTPGSVASIEWVADDDVDVTSVDISYSADGGLTYASVATGLPAYGSHAWTVPAGATSLGLLQVVAYDANGNTGFDVTDTTFTVGSGGGTAGQNIPYGTGKPGANGMPLLSSSTAPNIGSLWTADLTNALGASPAWLILGYAPASTPFDGGTMLVNYTNVYPVPTNGAGASQYSTVVPSNPGIIGLSVYWQVGIPNDPGAAGLGWAMSNGLETMVGL